MNDVPRAWARGGDVEPFGAGSFRKRAVSGTDDELRVSAFAQPSSQRQQRLLPAAPGKLSVNVGDGKRGQNPNVSLQCVPVVARAIYEL